MSISMMTNNDLANQVKPMDLGPGAGEIDFSSLIDLTFGAPAPLPLPSIYSAPAPAAKAQPSFANAFNAQLGAIRAQDDHLLDSPIGLSPASFISSASASPFDALYSSPFVGGDFGTPGTPEFDFSCGSDLPSLFASSLGGIAPAAVDATNGFDFTVPPAPTMHAQPSPAGAVSPVMLQLDSPAPEPVAVPAADLDVKPAMPARQASTSSSSSFVKDKFTGTRNTKIQPIAFDAPTLPKSYLTPSATSRKRAPAAITAKMPAAKKAKQAAQAAREASATPGLEANEEGLDPSELPDELLSAIELKRRQNTLAARRSRLRKAGHLAELQETISNLEGEVADWKAKYAELEEVVRALRGC
jgi:hypothetical protein